MALNPRLLRTMLLLAALLALSVRALVPAGFMPGMHDGRVTLEICTGQGLLKVDAGGKPAKETGTTSPVCAFAGVASPLLSALPFALLALAIAYILLKTSRTPQLALVPMAHRLRPPLRGPPAA